VTDKPTISVVDDDEAVRDALDSLLSALGYPVRTFASADDFIERSGAIRTACLISDVQMPGMNGVELMEHLEQSGAAIPTILVSAYSHEALRSRALRTGAIAWLDKPVRQDELLASIDRATH
jgi:FixJ family two-component response regulator